MLLDGVADDRLVLQRILRGVAVVPGARGAGGNTAEDTVLAERLDSRHIS
jgi:hypothetical protein